MTAPHTLLAAHEGNHGPFVDWLGKLGLAEFLKRYPLTRLVEWGWVVPQYRVCFPPRFFECWDRYPESPCNLPQGMELYSILWDCSWWMDSREESMWFLDPLFRPDDPAGNLVARSVFRGTDTPVPPAIVSSRGVPIAPYVDYFYRWQGYALVDVIRRAHWIEPILDTPDIVDRAQGVVRIAEEMDARGSDWPKEVLESPRHWGGLALPMTWLAHFSTFRGAFLDSRWNTAETEQLVYQQGAALLALHLGVDSEKLENAIKDQLLVLANDWMRLNADLTARSIWTLRAWPHLQVEIMLAVSWLIRLTGKRFEDYSTRWRLPYMGNSGWAKLEDALPYAFIKHQQTFARLAPKYLESFTRAPNNPWRLENARLAALIGRLQRENYPFGGFLAAFHELHEHLGPRPFDEHGLDFRERRPLDYFAQLAIHAEGCLRRQLDSLGRLDAISTERQGLRKYIEELAKERSLPESVIGAFQGHWREADLKKDQNDPIGRIQSLELRCSDAEKQVAKAFLCCLLARNYFAHHDFLDRELLHNDKAAFLMRGILLTVLVLLDSGGANERDPDAPV